MSNNNEDTFRRDWGYPREVRAMISDAVFFEINPIPGAYRSGRPRYEATFLSADRKKVVARRAAMQLVSRRSGQNYFVVRRADDLQAAHEFDHSPATKQAGFGLDDVILRGT